MKVVLTGTPADWTRQIAAARRRSSKTAPTQSPDVQVEERRYRWILGSAVAADWIRDRFGIDPNRVTGIDLEIRAGAAVIARITTLVTQEDLDALPELEQEHPDDFRPADAGR